MDGNEQIGLRFIGDFHAVSKPRIAVVFSGVHHLDFGQVFFDVGAQFQSDFKGDVLLGEGVTTRAKVAGIFASVPSVKHDHHGGG